ncbi:hypothetical protein D3C75_858960 [compost metagenome]
MIDQPARGQFDAAIDLRIVRRMRPLCEQGLRSFCRDDRVFEEAPRIAVHFRIGKFAHPHLADCGKNLLRSHCRGIQTGQITVGENRLPVLGQAQAHRNNDKFILIIMLEHAVAIAKLTLFGAQTYRLAGCQFDTINVFANMLKLDAIGTDILYRG